MFFVVTPTACALMRLGGVVAGAVAVLVAAPGCSFHTARCCSASGFSFCAGTLFFCRTVMCGLLDGIVVRGWEAGDASDTTVVSDKRCINMRCFQENRVYDGVQQYTRACGHARLEGLPVPTMNTELE